MLLSSLTNILTGPDTPSNVFQNFEKGFDFLYLHKRDKQT